MKLKELHIRIKFIHMKLINNQMKLINDIYENNLNYNFNLKNLLIFLK